MDACKHCGRRISGGGTSWVHLSDRGVATLGRCDPAESGLTYGYSAEPAGRECSWPCRGAAG